MTGCILAGGCGRDEEGVPDETVTRSGVMLGEVAAKIFGPGSPIYDELVLLDAVADPVEAHRAGFALLEGVVGDAGGGRVVGFDGGWRLGMMELLKCRVNRDGVLSVDEEAANFGFSGGCHHMAQSVANGTDGAVGRWSGGWRFGRVARL